jgi:hypothetical protein
MAQVTGRCYVKVNGQVLRTKEGAKLDNIGGVTREAVTGNEVYGFTEKVAAPSIECTLIDVGGFSLKDIHAITDTTVTFETDTGKVYILSHAWCESALSLTAGGGEVDCKFTGISCTEQL